MHGICCRCPEPEPIFGISTNLIVLYSILLRVSRRRFSIIVTLIQNYVNFFCSNHGKTTFFTELFVGHLSCKSLTKRCSSTSHKSLQNVSKYIWVYLELGLFDEKTISPDPQKYWDPQVINATTKLNFIIT